VSLLIGIFSKIRSGRKRFLKSFELKSYEKVKNVIATFKLVNKNVAATVRSKPFRVQEELLTTPEVLKTFIREFRAPEAIDLWW